MDRNEIITYLNYQGEYTKEVKKRLNKLIKKYHPDKNKNDNKTILILYDIKKELEKGTLEYKSIKEENIDSKVDNEDTYKVDINFIERLLRTLTREKKILEKRLESLYRRAYYYNSKIYSNDYDIGLVDIELGTIKDNINNLKKIDIFDIFVIFIIFILILLTILFRSFILLIASFIILFLDFVYLIYRKNLCIEYTKLLKKYELKKNKYVKLDKMYKEHVEEINKEELDVKRERNRINNDIAFYNYEISKSINYEKSNTDTKNYSYQKR